MQRLIIVYNPRSSKHALIEQEVLEPARKLAGFSVGKFEVKHVPLDENASALSKVLLDDDLVIAAGGDGTGAVALNGIMLSGVKATLAVLGYGNFNDFARMLGQKNIEGIIESFKGGDVKTLYPLEALVDGKHYRFSACYFTVGMFAESTKLFDQKKTRGSLKTGKKSLVYSVKELAKWYFKNKRREFLPGEIEMDGEKMTQVSDLLFVNGKTVAKMMKGGEFWQKPKEFLVATGRLTGFFRLSGFMFKSILKRMPGEIKKSMATVHFNGPSEVEIQGEGEYKRLQMSELQVRKAEQGIKVVTR